MIKFQRVRPGEYRAKRGPVYLWIFREWRPGKWWWVIGSEEGYAIWDLDSHHGPFTTRKAAIADALAVHALEGD